MAKNNNLTDFLTDVANAIRTKKGTTGTINPQNFSSEIASISGGGTQLYLHSIAIVSQDMNYEVYFSIYSLISNAFSLSDLYQLLYNKDFYVSGFVLMLETSKRFMLTTIKGRYLNPNDMLIFEYINENGDMGDINIDSLNAQYQDTVTAL